MYNNAGGGYGQGRASITKVVCGHRVVSGRRSKVKAHTGLVYVYYKHL